jgi:two-component system, LytTR family, response regulator
MYKCIIIDDESKARLLLRAIVNEYCPELIVVEECQDLNSGVDAIRRLKPDLVFLDIEMPGHTGLEILEVFDSNTIDFDIIFTTAYSEYAIQAFRLAALDYILKPIQFQRLRESVDRFIQKGGNTQSGQLEMLKKNLLSDSDKDKRVAIPVGQSYKFYKIDELVMIKGDGAYSEIYLDTGEKLIVSKNLKYFGEMLGSMTQFFRCHKSYLVNTRHVKEFIKSDGGKIILLGDIEASVSGEKVEEFLKLMNMRIS